MRKLASGSLSFKVRTMADNVQNLSEMLDSASDLYGDKRFAIDSSSNVELSFSGLKLASERLATALKRRFGIGPHEHVALLMPNCLELLPTYFGILRAGCVAVPVNARLKANELQFIL